MRAPYRVRLEYAEYHPDLEADFNDEDEAASYAVAASLRSDVDRVTLYEYKKTWGSVYGYYRIRRYVNGETA